MTAPDPKALKILFDTYWSSAGWKSEQDRNPATEDFEYAESAGLMFDRSSFTHDEIVARAMQVTREIQAQDVADAFLSSLGSRQLQWRSALGSLAVMSHLRGHGMTGGGRHCSVCGQSPRSEDVDWNVLNFERHKWGGVRHDHVSYAWFDLDRFNSITIREPSDEDVAIFRSILQAIEAAPPETTADKLEKHLGPILKSNKDERGILIAILGFVGILETTEYPGYRNSFIRADERHIPSRRFVDMPYPACWWKRTDGVNHDAVSYWFGHRLGKG